MLGSLLWLSTRRHEATDGNVILSVDFRPCLMCYFPHEVFTTCILYVDFNANWNEWDTFLFVNNHSVA